MRHPSRVLISVRGVLVKSRYCIAGLVLAAAVAPLALAQTSANVPANKPVAAAKPATAAEAKADASYSLGLSMGTQLHGLGVGPDAVTYEKVVAGLRAALGGKTASPEDSQRVQSLIEGARKNLGTANAAAADKFLADNGKKPGVITTASGLQYKVVRPGAGAAPKAGDQVTVDYEGKLLNGEVFDSSYKRGEAATFPVGGVIKGWQEALQLMQPGSKFELYIPPALAYDQNSPPPIPPGSLLVFTVELKSVKAAPPAAGPAPQPAPAAAPAAAQKK